MDAASGTVQGGQHMIVITGRDLPTCCADCPCVHMEGTRYCQAARKFNKVTAPFNGRPKWCPLREAKRGRLADSGELKD